MSGPRRRRLIRGCTALALAVVIGSTGTSDASATPSAVPAIACDAGSRPEPGLQGEVTKAARDSGDSALGYWCNLHLVGRYDSGEGASYQAAYYGPCAYYATAANVPLASPGTQVVDLSDPTHPVLTTNLITPGMFDPWESLKTNARRGLLVGLNAYWGIYGASVIDVYDVKTDCAHPKLLASAPVNLGLGHEGDFAPDGLTYYATGFSGLTAIDLTNPSEPVPLAHWLGATHGLSLSDDGNRLYQATADYGGIANDQGGVNGVYALDTSQVQARVPAPQITVTGGIGWADEITAGAQATIPVTVGGHPYLILFDETGGRGARILDLADRDHPVLVSQIQTEIQLPQNQALADSETGTSWGGYNDHYCNVPTRLEPALLACAQFQSGLRLYDIRDPLHPVQLGYFNPGGDGKVRVGSNRQGNGTSGYTSSNINLVPQPDGSMQIWFTDQDRGLYIVNCPTAVCSGP